MSEQDSGSLLENATEPQEEQRIGLTKMVNLVKRLAEKGEVLDYFGDPSLHAEINSLIRDIDVPGEIEEDEHYVGALQGVAIAKGLHTHRGRKRLKNPCFIVVMAFVNEDPDANGRIDTQSVRVYLSGNDRALQQAKDLELCEPVSIRYLRKLAPDAVQIAARNQGQQSDVDWYHILNITSIAGSSTSNASSAEEEVSDSA